MSKNKNKKDGSSSTTSRVKPTESILGKTTSTKAATPLLFQKQHFILILAGLGLILLGLLLMSGGHMPDNNTWDESIIYSPRRIVLAPIVILTGIALEIFAIFKK